MARSVTIGAEDEESLGGIECRIDVIGRAGAEGKRLNRPVAGLAIGPSQEDTESPGPGVGPHERQVVVRCNGGRPHRCARIDRLWKPARRAGRSAGQLDAPQRSANLIVAVIMGRETALLAWSGPVRCKYQITAAGCGRGFEIIPTPGEPCEDRS